MKIKLIVFGIIVSLLLIAGCALTEVPTKETKEPTTPEPQVKEEVKVKEEVTKPETPPAPPAVETKQEVGEPVEVEIPEEIRELTTKSDSKVKSYSYLYADAKDGTFSHTYFIKGTKIKVKLMDKDIYIKDKYYDTIYLDTSTKAATATCEDKRRCMSDKEDYTRKTFQVEYSDYIVKTPYEWVKEVLFAEIIGPELMNTRTATKIKYTQDGKISYMWLDDMYGMPLQVTQQDPETGIISKWQFTDYQFNTLRDSDIVPAFESDMF